MFEFHGWLSLRSDDRDDPDPAVLEARLDAAEAALLGEVEKAGGVLGTQYLIHTGRLLIKYRVPRITEGWSG